MTPRFTSHSVEETQQFAHELVQKYQTEFGQRPVIFLLSGDLGTGKTHFVKGLGQALGIQELILSPSFTLVNEYSFGDRNTPFIHIDAWRIPSIAELESVGWSRFLKQNAVIALEWPPHQEFSLPNAQLIRLQFTYGQKDEEREITLESV